MRQTRALRHPAALLAAVLVAGCAGVPGGTIVHSPLYKGRYDPHQVGAFGPSMPVQVVGQPPDGSDAEAVAGAMRLPARFRPTPLEASEGATRGPRLVVVFNPSGRLHYCDAPRSGGRSGLEGRMRVGLAYCNGEIEYTSVVLESRESAGPGDPAFTGVMLQGLQALLPPRNPMRDDDGPRLIGL
ncbi:MAG: hypothetical protein ACQEUZ_09635 [Pseudomonadota bacterium]